MMKKNEEKKIYTIKIQNEKDADFIINLLEQERIPYKIKPIRQKYNCGFFEMTSSSNNGYNIELHTDFIHYEYFVRVVCDEQVKYGLTIPISDISVSVLDIKSSEIQKAEKSISPSTPTQTQTSILPLTMLMMMSLPPLYDTNKKQESKEKKEQKNNKSKSIKKSMLKKIIDWIKEG